MRHWIVGALVLTILGAAAAPLRAAAPPPQTPELLTNRVKELEFALRRTRDGKQRAELNQELETVLHRLGPCDAEGRRLHPKSMWHDTRIMELEKEAARFGKSPHANVDLMLAGKRAVREIALSALTHGWALSADGRLGQERQKYQTDAFGQYLANNMHLLDALFDKVRERVPESTPAAPEADNEASAAPDASAAGTRPTDKLVDRIRKATGRLAEVAKVFEGREPPTEADGVRAMQTCHASLRTIHESVESLEAHADGTTDAEETGEGEDQETSEEPRNAPPPMTPEERAILARIRADAAALTGETWAEIQRYLKEYVTIVENGFEVPKARPKARDLLGEIDRAARLAKDLHGSRILYDGYLEPRTKELTDALGLMKNPLRRDRAYRQIRRLWRGDSMRRRLETGALRPGGARGVLYAQHVVVEKIQADARKIAARAAREEAYHRANRLKRACDAITDVAAHVEGWKGIPMPRHMEVILDRMAERFVNEASLAGSRLPGPQTAGVDGLLAAANRARDVRRIVQADRVIDAVRKYMPGSTGSMYARVVKAGKTLVEDQPPEAVHDARRQLDLTIRRFEGVEGFPLPGRRYKRAATQIAGRALSAAMRMLNLQLAKGIKASAEGDNNPLGEALSARYVFSLLRRRAVTETVGLDRASVASTPLFSVPPQEWDAFVQKLDAFVRTRLAAWSREGPKGWDYMQRPSDWHLVYHAVACAQREALDDQTLGESELDFFLRNLERVTAEDAGRHQWDDWAAGFHVIEAAKTLAEGFEQASAWHRGALGSFTWRLRRDTELDPEADE